MTTDGSRSLIVAPYPGEFGWELMNWQGRVRRVIETGDFRSVTLVGAPDRRALYCDLLKSMPSRVKLCPSRPMDLPGEACDDHRVDSAGQPLDPQFLRERIEKFTRRACRDAGFISTGDLLMPPLDAQMWPTTKPHQSFVSLHRAGPIDIDIAIIPRKRDLAPERNRPDAWWLTLANRLQSCGLVVAVCYPPMNAAISTLSRARLAIGASTGGLHLASLCECPHYVWGPGREATWTSLRITNRQRYETIWNPLGTECQYDECGWQPTIEHVVRQTLTALAKIGLPRRASERPRRASARWLLRRKLSMLITVDPKRSAVPWRVREFVRERLI